MGCIWWTCRPTYNTYIRKKEFTSHYWPVVHSLPRQLPLHYSTIYYNDSVTSLNAKGHRTKGPLSTEGSCLSFQLLQQEMVMSLLWTKGSSPLSCTQPSCWGTGLTSSTLTHAQGNRQPLLGWLGGPVQCDSEVEWGPGTADQEDTNTPLSVPPSPST